MDSPSQANSRRDVGPGRVRSFTEGLGFILALVAFSMSGYLWYVLARRDQIIGSHLVARVQQAQTAAALAGSNAQAAALQVARLRATQQSLRSEVTALGSGIGRQRQRWALAEAEQLLVIANHRLDLDHEVGLSLAALTAADRALHRLSDPRLLPVRHEIAREVAALEAVRALDISGVALKLQAMAAAVPGLPLGSSVVNPAATATSQPTAERAPAKGSRWHRFTQELRADFESLIRIQHDRSARPPLLPRREAYFVRQNLQLILYSAQLALLEHQQAVFRQNITQASQWLSGYYNTSDPAVAHMQQDLAHLGAAAAELQPPDISASLVALRHVREQMDRS